MLNDSWKELSNRAHDARVKKSPDAVLGKMARLQQQNLTVEQFLENVREREPRLYERDVITFARWQALHQAKLDETIAPDGLPYTLGPKVPKRMKVSLGDIITEYQKDLKEGDT